MKCSVESYIRPLGFDLAVAIAELQLESQLFDTCIPQRAHKIKNGKNTKARKPTKLFGPRN